MNAHSVVFVTGTLRSGTTLLSKLLALALDTSPIVQPVQLILVRLKALFLEQVGVPDWYVKYPLADDSFQTAIDMNAFIAFLERYRLERDVVQSWLVDDFRYSGVISKPDDDISPLSSWPGGDLKSFLLAYLAVLRAGAHKVVWKEVFCESYLPYLVRGKMPSVAIIRDPRDVILSQIAGNSDQHVGPRRPLLFQIRQWRKSVAWSLWLEEQAYGSRLSFEDLVRSPDAVVGGVLGSFFSPSAFTSLIKNARLNSNSSFSNFTTVEPSAIGRYKLHLRSDIREFIEAACWPEMRLLEYEQSLSYSEALEVLGQSKLSFPQERPELSYYEYCPERSREEIMRLKSLVLPDQDYRCEVHITRTAYAKLSAGLRAS